jgi:protein-L-isoaspartate(D-aspartate) O-methyltransferase
MESNDELIAHLKEDGVLRSADIEEALRAADRARFVREESRAEAYEDYPLPIGEGQTISQSTTVAYMLELLGARPGEKVLDIGSGSGWTTALLAHLVGNGGEVIGTELVPKLVEFGRRNLGQMHAPQARIEEARGALGRPDDAPFDRILVSAAAPEIPEGLILQLRIGGRMVIPIKDSLCAIDRTVEGYITDCREGFAFVPLVQ